MQTLMHIADKGVDQSIDESFDESLDDSLAASLDGSFSVSLNESPETDTDGHRADKLLETGLGEKSW